ncbi:YncE family protein [Phytohabitans sp. LJ34]|uniref:YncE family protein n=1 Tax=Phytohabitans sp. LJ34 TaxID=3452217 RepID=UPI003F89889C
MTNRRTVLQLAGLTGAGAVLGACDSGTAAKPKATPGDLLIVETKAGLSVVEAGTGKAMVPAAPSIITGDRTRLVRTEWTGKGTKLATYRLPGGEVVAGGVIRDKLDARVVSADGRLVALASPAGPRSRTTIAVADGSGERIRVDLIGNLEPEAFDVTGQYLFVLDYLPPTAPDRYRVRALDLHSGKVEPLLNRAKAVLPPGAEEEMRGQGRQAVYDTKRQQLFTLYTHQPDHLHSRDLLAGARDSAPHVHAFVHTLHLGQRWAFCIDLPEPFGVRAAERHAIALSGDGLRLCVVDAVTGTVAVIDPEGLNVVRTMPLSAPTGDGPATAAVTADGQRLVVGGGDKVVVMPLGGSGSPTRWSPGSQVRGLALLDGAERAYVGQDGAVTAHDLTTGGLLSRTVVPGLVSVRQAVAR